jgi:hypothetical protein
MADYHAPSSSDVTARAAAASSTDHVPGPATDPDSAAADRAEHAATAVPRAERLVNLTEHDVAVEAMRPPKAGDGWGSPGSTMLTIAPDGRVARVADDDALLDEGWLNADGGLIRHARLRRSRRVAGLPPAEMGVRYLVPRLTALAAWSRTDLVFPFREVREGGRIVAVRGLASFRARRDLAAWLRDRRAARRDRRSRQMQGRQWVTAVMFASATALLSGALGLLPGALDNASKKGWAGGGQGWTAWLTVVFGAVGAGLLVWAAVRWRRLGTLLEDRGTAYVIEEQQIAWQHEEKASVLALIGREFASVLRVPGPVALDESWSWQADLQGLPHWDKRTDELVRAFWAVHYNDNQETHNAVFTWAPWPVAMAFGARATARRRGLVLHVRQRPSFGAGTHRQRLIITDGAYDFVSGTKLADDPVTVPGYELTKLERSLTICLTEFASDRAATHSPTRGSHGARDVVPLRAVLLAVRLQPGPIGAIPWDLDEAGEIPIGVPPELAQRALLPGRHTVEYREWRLISQPGSTSAAEVPWTAFPDVAGDVARWVCEQVGPDFDGAVLLASRMPQEIAVGLGIRAGQLGRSWPARVYPVFYDEASHHLVVPDLQLGSQALPTGQR